MNLYKSLLLLALYFSSQVFAGGHNLGNYHSRHNDHDVSRSYLYLSTSNGFTLAGTSINGTLSKHHSNVTVDSSVFNFNTVLSFPTFIWAYYQGKIQGRPFDLSGSLFASAFIPTYIVEYIETNNETGYQNDNDTMVGWVNLGKLEYDITDTTEQLTNPDTGKNFTVYHVTATSTNGLYQMNFTVSESPISINDTTNLSSEQSKIDIGIFDYYNATVNPRITDDDDDDEDVVCDFDKMNCDSTGPSNNQTSLALVSFFAALEFDLEVKNPRGRISVKNNGDFNAGFDWVGHAKVSHHNGTVNFNASVHSNCSKDDNNGKFGSKKISTILKGKTSYQFLTYSFEGIRPDSVMWDPVIGATSNIDNGTSSESNNTSSVNSDESDGSNAYKILSSFSLIISLFLFALLF